MMKTSATAAFTPRSATIMKKVDLNFAPAYSFLKRSSCRSAKYEKDPKMPHTAMISLMAAVMVMPVSHSR